MSRVILHDRQILRSTSVWRQFLPARRVLAVVMCLCVRLSQVGVLLKRLHVGSHKQRHTIARDCSFLMPKISAKLKRGHPNGGAKCRWG